MKNNEGQACACPSLFLSFRMLGKMTKKMAKKRGHIVQMAENKKILEKNGRKNLQSPGKPCIIANAVTLIAVKREVAVIR